MLLRVACNHVFDARNHVQTEAFLDKVISYVDMTVDWLGTSWPDGGGGEEFEDERNGRSPSAGNFSAMILQVDPEAPAWVHTAANAMLVLHIGGGAVGLVSGTVALAARKGARVHRMAGNVFFVSMLIMSAIGAGVAPFLPERASTLAGILTFYLVATAWMTIQRKEGAIGRFEIGAFVVALGLCAAALILGVQAMNSPTGTLDDQPFQAFFIFGTIAPLAAAFDLKVILRRGIAGARRIARHLWRMCVALFIAAASFFLGQPQVFPEAVRDSLLLLAPEIAILGLMVFWLLRVRFTNQFKTAQENL